ncbi:MAG TPA: fused response regulator/phosphatase [Abditibacteriaceae bacterium]|nr:fused response regulator/phosphatase [Abditibacteriaceae bacterium]
MASPSVASPKRILIVDDEEFNRELLEGLVESFGHESQTAADGAEALARVTPETDLVLLDAMMPGMDGFEVARRIRADARVGQIPIVMVTALTSKEDRLLAVEAGANDFITKPIDRTELKVRMTSLLKMKEAQDAIKRSEAELRARNALMQADLDLARAMQQAFIHKPYPSFPPHVDADASALRFYHRYIPTTALGGDFFDVLALSPTQAGVFICDVMGHGVRSALVTAMMRALVGGRNSVAADPSKFLAAINHHLLSILDQAHAPMFASAFYLIADLAQGRLSYANAGHPSPLRVRRDAGTTEWLLGAESPSGPALGVFKDAVYETGESELAADDLFVLFTDGVFEVEGSGVAGASGEYGEARLIAAMHRHMQLPTPALFDELLLDIRQFSASGDFEDDVCLVGMEVAHQGTPLPGDSSPENA